MSRAFKMLYWQGFPLIVLFPLCCLELETEKDALIELQVG